MPKLWVLAFIALKAVLQGQAKFVKLTLKLHHALVFASQRPSENEAIEVISGYWKRGYSCGNEAFIHELREDHWTIKDSLRYSRPGCETIGGTSGSPIVRRETKIVQKKIGKSAFFLAIVKIIFH